MIVASLRRSIAVLCHVTVALCERSSAAYPMVSASLGIRAHELLRVNQSVKIQEADRPDAGEYVLLLRKG